MVMMDCMMVDGVDSFDDDVVDGDSSCDDEDKVDGDYDDDDYDDSYIPVFFSSTQARRSHSHRHQPFHNRFSRRYCSCSLNTNLSLEGNSIITTGTAPMHKNTSLDTGLCQFNQICIYIPILTPSAVCKWCASTSGSIGIVCTR